MGLMDGQEIEMREPALCQYDKEPCIKEQCNAWITYQRADGKTFVGCSILFEPVMLGELIQDTQKTAAELSKLRGETRRMAAKLNEVIGLLASPVRQLRDRRPIPEPILDTEAEIVEEGDLGER